MGVAHQHLLLAPSHLWARWVLGAILAGLAAAALGWWWPESRKPPKLFALPAYLAVGNIAALQASLKALAGTQNPVWEPTRRETVQVAGQGEG